MRLNALFEAVDYKDFTTWTYAVERICDDVERNVMQIVGWEPTFSDVNNVSGGRVVLSMWDPKPNPAHIPTKNEPEGLHDVDEFDEGTAPSGPNFTFAFNYKDAIVYCKFRNLDYYNIVDRVDLSLDQDHKDIVRDIVEFVVKQAQWLR